MILTKPTVFITLDAPVKHFSSTHIHTLKWFMQSWSNSILTLSFLNSKHSYKSLYKTYIYLTYLPKAFSFNNRAKQLSNHLHKGKLLKIPLFVKCLYNIVSSFSNKICSASISFGMSVLNFSEKLYRLLAIQYVSVSSSTNCWRLCAISLNPPSTYKKILHHLIYTT